MKKTKIKQDHPKEFTFPVAMYYIARFFNRHPKLTLRLSNWESKRLRKKIEQVKIEKPIFVLGLARAGTTITVEMLGRHPDVAYHKYLHLVNPYLPHWIQKIANILPIFKKPVERLHKDKLLVNRDSPEAVEESYWMRFFDNIRKEKTSDILDKSIVNPEFEKYYVEIIKKLLVNQKSSRYIAKNNYNVSRMEYIKRLFPDAKFIFMTRNPINHIASLVKQDKVLKDLETDDERLLDWTKIMGHREFGSAKICINLDNLSTIKEIRKRWLNRETYVEGWAIYWVSIHQYILDLLNKNKEIAESTMLLRYEDLTDQSVATIDKILEFTEISAEEFASIKRDYKDKLKQPDYYEPSFSDREIKIIKEYTEEIARKFDYQISNNN